jgi:hypothetical protein
VASGSLGTISVTAFSGGDNPTSELVPGGSSDLIVRIDNTNAYAVTLTAISLNGSITVSGSLGACTASSVSTSFPSSPSINVAASSSQLIHLSGAISMSTSAPNGCQDATFAVPVSVTFEK